MTTRSLEITVGLFVALGLAALFLLAMQVSNFTAWGKDEGYTVTARFDNIGGLTERAPVRMGGVKIGSVKEIDYDQEGFQAVVHMNIDGRYDALPTDTSAGIFTAGLLGENYVSLQPGGEEEVLKDGDHIHLTQSALVLEQIIGQFLFSQTAEGNN